MGDLEKWPARGGYGEPALNHFMARWRNLAVRVAMLRAEYRAAGRYDDADRLRGILEADGVIVTDRETETRLEFDGVPAGRPVSIATLIEGTIWTVTVTG